MGVVPVSVMVTLAVKPLPQSFTAYVTLQLAPVAVAGVVVAEAVSGSRARVQQAAMAAARLAMWLCAGRFMRLSSGGEAAGAVRRPRPVGRSARGAGERRGGVGAGVPRL